MRILGLALIVAAVIGGETLRVVHLSPDDARELREAHERFEQARDEYERLEQADFEKYVTYPALAKSGDWRIAARSILSGWEYGMEFSGDFAVAVPQQKPEVSPCATHDAFSDHYKDTIPEKLWLEERTK